MRALKTAQFTWIGDRSHVYKMLLGPVRDFLKISPCCLQRHLERPQLFYLNTEMIVKQGFRVF